MRKKYFVEMELNENFMNKIKNSLKNNKHGRTINNVMQDTKLSRGTVKLYLSALVVSKEIKEIDYNQNTKVYFWKANQKLAGR